MKDEINEIITNRVSKWRFIFWLFLGLFILFIVLFLVVPLMIGKEPIEFSKLIIEEINYGKDISNQYAMIDISKIEEKPISLQINKTETEDYYFGYDESGKIYLVHFNKSDLIHLLYQKNNKYRVKGLTSKISDDLRNKTIETYNEIFNQSISDKDFNEIFSLVYLDTDNKPGGTVIFLIGVSLILIFLCLPVVASKYIIIIIALKKFNKEYKDLFYNDLESSNVVKYNNLNIVCTNNYLFDYKEIDLIKYSDILWVHRKIEEYDNEKITTEFSLELKNGETCLFINQNLKEENRKGFGEELKELVTKLKEINGEELLIGYTKENKLRYKELIRVQKNGKKEEKGKQ